MTASITHSSHQSFDATLEDTLRSLLGQSDIDRLHTVLVNQQQQQTVRETLVSTF